MMKNNLDTVQDVDYVCVCVCDTARWWAFISGGDYCPGTLGRDAPRVLPCAFGPVFKGLLIGKAGWRMRLVDMRFV